MCISNEQVSACEEVDTKLKRPSLFSFEHSLLRSYSCFGHSILTSHGPPHTGHFRSRVSPIAPKASQQLLHHVPRVLQSQSKMDCQTAFKSGMSISYCSMKRTL